MGPRTVKCHASLTYTHPHKRLIAFILSCSKFCLGLCVVSVCYSLYSLQFTVTPMCSIVCDMCDNVSDAILWLRPRLRVYEWMSYGYIVYMRCACPIAHPILAIQYVLVLYARQGLWIFLFHKFIRTHLPHHTGDTVSCERIPSTRHITSRVKYEFTKEL